MKKLVCLLLVLMVLFSGCGVDLSRILEEEDKAVPLPDENVVEYRQLRYYTTAMDYQDYMNFCAMYTAAINFEEVCKLPFPTQQEKVENVFAILHYECPELMMLEPASYQMWTYDGTVTEVELPYCMEQEEYETYRTQTKAVIDDLAAQCQDLSDAETEKLIYDHIVSNCLYDDAAQWAGTAYGCLVLGIAKCDGISAAMKWALEETGISCLTISGEPGDGTVGHAWNVVCIDGKWYDLDVTADVGRDEDSLVTYPAYNVSDTWIRNRYIVDAFHTAWGDIPAAVDMTGSYHALNDCYVAVGADDGLEEMFARAYKEKSYFILQFESQDDFDTFQEELEDRINAVGYSRGWRSWSWTTWYVPDYRTIRISADK